MDGPDAFGSLPRRLNGRPAACDACRARKVACDHARPVCGRCRRKNDGSPCVYSESRWAPHQSAPRPSRLPPTPRSPRRTPGAGGVRSPGFATAPSPQNPPLNLGYRGDTSYTVVFEEAKNSLPPFISSPTGTPGGPGGGGGGGYSTRQRQEGMSLSDLPAPVREMSLFVLQCLFDVQLEITDDDTLPKPHGWADIAVERILSSIQALLFRFRDHREQGVQAIAEMLCRNTARPMRDDCSSFQEWVGQICDDQLRWESLGFLWAFVERISDPVNALRCHHLAWSKGTQTIEMSVMCLTYCIDLSRYFNEGSVLLADLCRRKGTLESIVDGETRASCATSGGVACAMMTFLGLHAQSAHSATGTYIPTFFSEYKRRVFAQVFISDKSCLAIDGRPPLLNRRYCSTPIPLDLRDEVLASDEETIMRAVQSLDDRGWNTDGGLYPTSLLRARLLITYIRDELVEIALSHDISVGIDHLLSLKARQITTYSSFPPSLIYKSGDLNEPDVDIRTVYIKMILQLEHLQNVFYAERLLNSRGHLDQGEILVTSFSMLSLPVLFWTNRESFSHDSMRRQFEWVFLEYGAPAAGVLCLELLRPTFSGIHPKDPKVSRSSIIQQLSLLVGFFDWNRPSAPNSDLCADCKAVVQRVLDHCLNSGPELANVAFSDLDWSFANQPGFNFELLDTFDWLRTDEQLNP